jgi:hypothetical protein
MIEVYKTNIKSTQRAFEIIDAIHRLHPEVTANFDLADCDNILRIDAGANEAIIQLVQRLLERFGCRAEVLKDEIPNPRTIDLKHPPVPAARA